MDWITVQTKNVLRCWRNNEISYAFALGALGRIGWSPGQAVTLLEGS